MGFEIEGGGIVGGIGSEGGGGESVESCSGVCLKAVQRHHVFTTFQLQGVIFL